MTVCPIAIVAGCQKCPAFSICPAKGILGEQKAAAPGDAPGLKSGGPLAAS